MSSLTDMERGAGRMFKSAVNGVARAQLKANRLLKKIENNYALSEEEKLLYDKIKVQEIQKGAYTLEEGSEPSTKNINMLNFYARNDQLPTPDSIASSVSDLKLGSSFSSLASNSSEDFLMKSKSFNKLKKGDNISSCDIRSSFSKLPYMSSNSLQEKNHHEPSHVERLVDVLHGNNNEKSEYDIYKIHNVSKKDFYKSFNSVTNPLSINDGGKKCSISSITSDYSSLESFPSYSSYDGFSTVSKVSSFYDCSVSSLNNTPNMFDNSSPILDTYSPTRNDVIISDRVRMNNIDYESPKENIFLKYTCPKNFYAGKVVHDDDSLFNANQRTSDNFSNLVNSSVTNNKSSPNIFASDSNVFTLDVLSNDCFIPFELDRIFNLTEDLLENVTSKDTPKDVQDARTEYLKKLDNRPVNNFNNILRELSGTDISYYSNLCDILLEDNAISQ